MIEDIEKNHKKKSLDIPTGHLFEALPI